MDGDANCRWKKLLVRGLSLLTCKKKEKRNGWESQGTFKLLPLNLAGLHLRCMRLLLLILRNN